MSSEERVKRGGQRSGGKSGRARAAKARLPQGIQSIELGGDVLRALGRAREPLPLRDIAADARMPRGKARRYLLSFTRIGLAEQDEDTGFYRLGPLAIQLGLAAVAGLDVARVGSPIMAELRRTTQETIVLAIWSDNGPTVLRFEESRRPVTLNVRVGSTIPMTRSATGLVFAAFLDLDDAKARIAEELADARAEGPSRAELAAALAEVRRRGLARVEGTLLPGVSALGAPVFDHRGQLVAALVAVGHNGIMDTSWDGPIARSVAAAADELSRRLGAPETAGASAPG